MGDAADQPPSERPAGAGAPVPTHRETDARLGGLPPRPPRSGETGDALGQRLGPEIMPYVARHLGPGGTTALASTSRWYQQALEGERHSVLLAGVAGRKFRNAPSPRDVLDGTVSLSVSPTGKAFRKPLVLGGITSLPYSLSGKPLQRLLENPNASADGPALYEEIFAHSFERMPHMSPVDRASLLGTLAEHLDELPPERQSHYFSGIVEQIGKDPHTLNGETLEKLLENPSLDDTSCHERIFTYSLERTPHMPPVDRASLLGTLAKHLDELPQKQQSHYFFGVLAQAREDKHHTWPLGELIDKIRSLPDHRVRAFSGCLAMVAGLDEKHRSFWVGNLAGVLPSLGKRHAAQGMLALIGEPDTAAAVTETGVPKLQMPANREDRYEIMKTCLGRIPSLPPEHRVATVSQILDRATSRNLGRYAGSLVVEVASQMRYWSLSPEDEETIKSRIRPFMYPGY
ncbi:hypothetical protein CY652_09035 [Burkholderia sp. WAC0059]|uniref:hypothetical protein n=1 Tax=Burkholderia sp. WAC0059 TaxID=2066022 RepID=UPI000C7F2E1E|nr:hypothetical protein [Burkholderia sp. WAC0059]PLZ02675.1 hypothetical protein CY652_09035 [Burkholderia sp. WAC0059]